MNSPQTGDRNQAALWSAMAVMSMAAAAGTMAYRRKKKRFGR